MNKRRYSNRRRKNILRVFILLMAIIITVVMRRTIKIDVQVGELTLPKILQLSAISYLTYIYIFFANIANYLRKQKKLSKKCLRLTI